MSNRKIFHISRNIIAITVTICMLLYLGYAEHAIQKAYANPSMYTEVSTGIPDDVSAEDSSTADGTEDAADNEGTYVDDRTNGGTGVDNIAVSQVAADETEASEENTQSSSQEENAEKTVVASITYSYEVQTTESDEEDSSAQTEETKVVTETKEYYTLSDAFAGAAAVTAKLSDLGIADYVPTIQLLQDMELSEAVLNTENASFTMDLNGHYITLSEEAYLDFGEGNVTLTDVAYIAARLLKASGKETEDVRLGGVTGAGSYLFTGTGNLVFTMGYYEADGEEVHGSIINRADTVQISDGYYIAETGRIVNKTEKLTITGGFFVYDVSLGIKNVGELILPDEQALVETQILLGDVSMTGLMLGSPNYMVAISVKVEEEKKQINTYYADFASAWEQAAALSSANNGAVATITVYNSEIQGINMSQSYALDKDADGNTAAVTVSGMNFKRADGYGGSMFVVNDGQLILEGCTLDGTMGENAVANASLIKVSGKATLSMISTTVTNNCSPADTQTKDPGAGIFLMADATMDVYGTVCVSNNKLYVPAEEDTEEVIVPRNVYMAAGSSIVVSGTLEQNGAVGKIGITHEDDIIAGLTVLGDLSNGFVKERQSSVTEGESIVVDDVLSVFTADEHPSYLLHYDDEANTLYWDRTIKYLPEAGWFRMEFLLLLIGLVGFICRNMTGLKNNKVGNRVITTAAILCLIGGSVVGILHLRQEQELYYENMQTVQQMTSQEEHKATVSNTEVETEETEPESESVGLDVPDDGRNYYGIIEIPQLNIKLPVLAAYSDANMKTTPCVYYGDAKDNNLVIVGHNYDSQFAAFNDLEEEIEITVSTMDGSVYTYKSFAVEYLDPDQVDEMLTGSWDLTVFTCNYAGDKRIAVRCVLNNEE